MLWATTTRFVQPASLPPAHREGEREGEKRSLSESPRSESPRSESPSFHSLPPLFFSPGGVTGGTQAYAMDANSSLCFARVCKPCSGEKRKKPRGRDLSWPQRLPPAVRLGRSLPRPPPFAPPVCKMFCVILRVFVFWDDADLLTR